MSRKSTKKGKKGGDALYIKISEKLISSDWEVVYKELDAGSKKKLYAILGTQSLFQQTPDPLTHILHTHR